MSAVCPPTVIVALRAAGDAFGSAANDTLPGPEPVSPTAIRTHAALLFAVHEQPSAAVTPTLPDPPAAATAWAAGERPTEQASAVCVTVIVWPATVSVPVRSTVAGFACTA